MRVLSIVNDRKIFDPGSAVYKRHIDYGGIFEELYLVVFTSGSNEKEQKIRDNVFLYPTKSKNRLSCLWDAFKIGRKIIKEKNLGKNTVITAQDPYETGLSAFLLKIFSKLPLQIQIHTDFANKYFIFHSLANAIRFAIAEVVLSFADAVRVVSQRVAKSLHNQKESIEVLPVFVSLDGTSPKEYSVKEKIIFLSTARLEKEKDVGTAIRAFKQVIDSNIKAEFIIVGDGREMDNLKKLAQELSIGDKVVFEGWHHDLSSYYSRADIFVSASLYEGYGMSIVEAASYGLPLVISDAGVAGEIFSQEEAFICKQKNISHFGEVMKKLASSLELRKKIGEGGREKALASRISYEDYLDNYYQTMNMALESNSKGHSIFKRNILLRYLVAGFTAAFSQIFLLYIFTDIFKIWYLYSSIFAFIFAIVLSFLLQKFWTFGDKALEKARLQFSKYFFVGVLGVGINTLCMFMLVDLFGLWYLLAQVITGGLIAVFNFLMYKFFIFNKR